MDRVPLCSVCANPATAQIQRCSRCHAFYCSARCQHWDWDTDGHFNECIPGRGAQAYTHPALVNKNRLGEVHLGGVAHGVEMTDKQKRFSKFVHGKK